MLMARRVSQEHVTVIDRTVVPQCQYTDPHSASASRKYAPIDGKHLANAALIPALSADPFVSWTVGNPFA